MYFTLYSIPLNEEDVLQEYSVCKSCGTKLRAENYRAARPGGRTELVVWACPKCQNSNPNYSYRCLKCGYSVV